MTPPTQNNSKSPPLPNPPFLPIPNINNLRDASLASGGLTTSTGERVRSGVLFRSAEVSGVDAEGWKALHEVGVAHVFDLRSKPEVEKGWRGATGEKTSEQESANDAQVAWLQAMSAAGVERTWVPVFDAEDYSPERLAERYLKYMDESVQGFVQAYRDILSHAGPAFRTILLYLAGLPPQDRGQGEDRVGNVGALVHCTAGKDRTGVFFGVLFAFLGVSREDIADEYHITEVGLAHVREEVVGRLMGSPAFQRYLREQTGGVVGAGDGALKNEGGDGEDEVRSEVLEKGRRAALRMIGARRESILAVLEMVDEVWGGAEGYLRKVCGLDGEVLERLRGALVVSV